MADFQESYANLYLACAAIDAGTCAVGAYPQDEMDAFVDVV